MLDVRDDNDDDDADDDDDDDGDAPAVKIPHVTLEPLQPAATLKFPWRYVALCGAMKSVFFGVFPKFPWRYVALCGAMKSVFFGVFSEIFEI